MTGDAVVCRVTPDLVDHVRQLLHDAGLASSTTESDNLTAVTVASPDEEHARSVIGLVLPELLNDDTASTRLSDRLVRGGGDTPSPPAPAPPTPAPPGSGLPGGLIDARPSFGYADPLAEHEDADDHTFVPPEPPPVPRPKDPVARFAWAGVIAGPILLFLVVLGDLPTYLTAVGLAMFIGGFGTLVARKDDPPRDGWDDGAVV